jgi:hypothetical protein
LESDKIHITDPVTEVIKNLDPNDRKLVVGVLSLLEDDNWRDIEKIDFGIIHSEQTWAVAASRVTVVFVEESDGTITVILVNMRSRMHPSWL